MKNFLRDTLTRVFSRKKGKRMSRPAGTPSSELHFRIRTELRDQLEAHLTSPTEGRVPYGAYAKFFDELLVTHFTALERKAELERCLYEQ